MDEPHVLCPQHHRGTAVDRTVWQYGGYQPQVSTRLFCRCTSSGFNLLTLLMLTLDGSF